MKILRDFKCTQCGLCCQNISKILPEFDLGNGTCKYYDPDTKLCTIYEDRPLVCRVKDYWLLNDTGLSWKEWCDLNYQVCQKLQEENNNK